MKRDVIPEVGANLQPGKWNNKRCLFLDGRRVRGLKSIIFTGKTTRMWRTLDDAPEGELHFECVVTTSTKVSTRWLCWDSVDLLDA